MDSDIARSAGERQANVGELTTEYLRRSWQRCQLDAAAVMDASPFSLGHGALQERLDQHARLLAAAQPEIEVIAGMVGHASSVILLADPSGVILRSTGSKDFLRQAEQIALRPGVSWSENHRGTNAVGTALIESAPVRVHAGQHYLDCNRILSCSAAPILSSRGDVLGALNISNDAGVFQVYALDMAKMCARQTANRLIEQGSAGRQQLVLQRNPALLNTAEKGLLLLEDGIIVGANDAAVSLLRSNWRSILDHPVGEWIENWKTLGSEPSEARSRRGDKLYAMLQSGADSRNDAGRSARAPGFAVVLPKAPAAARGARQELLQSLPQLSAPASHAVERAVRVLDAGLATMLLGETGTGKEVHARHLHAASRWGGGPFVAVNCTALPETLIEAELFGYEAGAFTGARRGGARGRLREAQGGVLFLDEIGDMPLSLQARLLRVLQERVVQPLGSSQLIPVEFGVVSATNRNLEQLIEQGQFRSDLYYRLQDYKLSLPPLREREDLRSFLCTEFDRCSPAGAQLVFSDDALDLLMRYPWPGNYRELVSVLRTRALFEPPGSGVRADHLPADIVRRAKSATGRPGAAREPLRSGSTLGELRRDVVERTLAQVAGSIGQAARLLGVHRSTLYRYVGRERMEAPPTGAARGRRDAR